MEKIVINGATGLIGKKLVDFLLCKGYYIVILTRNYEKAKNTFDSNDKIHIQEFKRHSPDELVNLIKGAKSIINLAGASIAGKRWSEKYKKELYDSRINSTKQIAEAISLTTEKPESFITASAIGFYQYNDEKEFTEDSPPGDDFLSNLCKDWEKESLSVNKYGVRSVQVRIGLVLDKDGGALERLVIPFKFFTGAYLGNGRQWYSWIHCEDLINIIIFSIEKKGIIDGINATAPNPMRNKEFSKTIGKVMRRPCLFFIPGFFLKIVLGEFAQYLIRGQRVIPDKAVANGFSFKYNVLEDALINLLK